MYNAEVPNGGPLSYGIIFISVESLVSSYFFPRQAITDNIFHIICLRCSCFMFPTGSQSFAYCICYIILWHFYAHNIFLIFLFIRKAHVTMEKNCRLWRENKITNTMPKVPWEFLFSLLATVALPQIVQTKFQ